ncbi:Nramp family divalent metal transporter [Candidatus Microgenomates bacterium]|nr:Nramp family divalent metal transporter [Candidatus Microgenomates bacterium]
MNLAAHTVEHMPPPPRFRALLGPSFILLGLGLGSGELILWPFLTSNYGMGIIWGAVLGITMQFFINMEIERYSLVRGESIFVGFARKLSGLPFWFIFSTFIGFGWPGIVGASAKLVGNVFGIDESHYVAMGMLVLMGLILTLGPVLYKTVERVQMGLIAIGVPSIFILVLLLADPVSWVSFFKGLVGVGGGYFLLPEGLPIASFLAAFAFAGAGGNLNLAQSFYIKEKGYGMGRFSGRITSILTGKVENIKLEGARFEMDKENLGRFRKWWELINREHLLVFWATGAFTISLLGLLAYATVFGKTTPAAGINFVLYEAAEIGLQTAPIIGTIFLVLGGVMLFATQMTVLDATSRVMAENLLLIRSQVWKPKILPSIYYSFLWAQIVFGAIVFLTNLREPLFLLTLGAVINAGAMAVHVALTLWLNITSLERQLRPSLLRQGAMVAAFLFLGYFTARVLLESVFKV